MEGRNLFQALRDEYEAAKGERIHSEKLLRAQIAQLQEALEEKERTLERHLDAIESYQYRESQFKEQIAELQDEVWKLEELLEKKTR